MDDATDCAWCGEPDAEARDEDDDPCCLVCWLLAESERATSRTRRAIARMNLNWPTTRHPQCS